MGSKKTEKCRGGGEDLHDVTLTHGFEIQSTEVTQAEFQALMGYNPSHHTNCGNDCPVEMVTWHEAAAYCNALSVKRGHTACYTCTGSQESTRCELKSPYADSAFYSALYTCPGYRLPTDAEWEYAYRAGTSTALYNGDVQNCRGSEPDANLSKIGWYGAISDISYSVKGGCTSRNGRCVGPHPVSQKDPNPWGLYDMSGNIQEWCQDWDTVIPTNGDEVTDPLGIKPRFGRIARGGSWSHSPGDARAAARFITSPDKGGSGTGFRCVRSLEP